MPIYRQYGQPCIIDGITLIESGTTNFKINPTIVNGDVVYSIDGGDLFEYTIGVGSSIVTPPGSCYVRLSPDAIMMTGKRISFKFVDQTNPKEWDDYEVIVETINDVNAMIPVFAGATLAEIEASEWLLRSLELGRNIIATNDESPAQDGSSYAVSAKGRMYHSPDVFDHLATVRQARHYGSDYWAAGSLNANYVGPPDPFVLTFYELDGITPQTFPATETVYLTQSSLMDGSSTTGLGSWTNGIWTPDPQWLITSFSYSVLNAYLIAGTSPIPEGILKITVNCDSQPWTAEIRVPALAPGGNYYRGDIHKSGYLVDRGSRPGYGKEISVSLPNYANLKKYSEIIATQIANINLKGIKNWNTATSISVTHSSSLSGGATIDLYICNWGTAEDWVNLDGGEPFDEHTERYHLGTLSSSGWTSIDSGTNRWGDFLKITTTSNGGAIPAGVLTITVATRTGQEVVQINIPATSSANESYFLGADGGLYRVSGHYLGPVFTLKPVEEQIEQMPEIVDKFFTYKGNASNVFSRIVGAFTGSIDIATISLDDFRNGTALFYERKLTLNADNSMTNTTYIANDGNVLLINPQTFEALSDVYVSFYEATNGTTKLIFIPKGLKTTAYFYPSVDGALYTRETNGMLAAIGTSPVVQNSQLLPDIYNNTNNNPIIIRTV